MIKVTTNETSQQMVEITQPVVTPPSRKIPADAFVKQTSARIAVLQSQINDLQAQLDEVQSQGVDTVAILKPIKTPA